MTAHIWPIVTALAFFILLANLLAIPWMIYQYRKHGYFNLWRSLIIISFLFYLMTAYFLVILPIPEVRDNCIEMANAVYSQLRPFQFIHDIERETGIVWTSLSTYPVLLKARSVYQVVFNVFLLLPLGVYLRYFLAGRSKWYHASLIGFFVSLFFEVTQRTALFGLFACPYRLFDVDDLMLNTLGATLGYFIAPMILFFVPDKEKIKEQDLQFDRRNQASYGIQLVELAINLALANFMTNFLVRSESSLLIHILIFSIFLFLLVVLLPAMKKGVTLGGLILRIRTRPEPAFFSRLMKRYAILLLPYLFSQLASALVTQETDEFLLVLFSLSLWVISYLIWALLLGHLLLKWFTKADAPYFNQYAQLKLERMKK